MKQYPLKIPQKGIFPMQASKASQKSHFLVGTNFIYECAVSPVCDRLIA
jgi:hypothetical protein